ncbi:hypothetical protein A7K94_0200995 [Modestobacter sp. VKM Ac-2676]|nr:hypothetical protein A7K94_0200995 [Modestobacter sp. VKM Ac-2676]
MTSSDGDGEDYQLGVALVSILVSISISVGFGVYSAGGRWWFAVLLAVCAPAVLAGLIRLGGEDGWIGKAGKWVLGS